MHDHHEIKEQVEDFDAQVWLQLWGTPLEKKTFFLDEKRRFSGEKNAHLLDSLDENQNDHDVHEMDEKTEPNENWKRGKTIVKGFLKFEFWEDDN